MTNITAKTANSAAATFGPDVNPWLFLKNLLCAIRHGFGAASRAHDRRRASEAVGPETMRDTGMAPEAASGHQAWQADLPFFMQSGFGKRE